MTHQQCGASGSRGWRPLALAASLASLISMVACETSGSEPDGTVRSSTNSTVTATTATNSPAIAATASTSTAPATGGTVVNKWSGAVVDPTRLPIGDSRVSTTGASVGGLWACNPGNPNAGGASADGPWLNRGAGTWDSTTKLAVKGSITWESANYTETVTNGKRVIATKNLPVTYPTGTFPISRDDPSYAYDRNPGTITAQTITVSLPETGTIAASPSCMREGPVGVLRNGVLLFNSLDGRGEDAVAHESQDLCNGHPAMTTYHYHNVPVCVRDAATGPSTVVGWAYDGFPIVVERDPGGALPTNADLDECHGRTSPIELDGTVVTIYHYSATLEFPYFIGCYRGTRVS